MQKRARKIVSQLLNRIVDRPHERGGSSCASTRRKTWPWELAAALRGHGRHLLRSTLASGTAAPASACASASAASERTPEVVVTAGASASGKTVRLGFSELPECLVIAGDFDNDCFVELHPNTLKQLRSRRLKITIQKMGGQPRIHAFHASFGLVRGEIRIFAGNDGQTVWFGDDTSGRYDLTLWRAANVRVGPKTTSNGVRIFCADSEFIAGADCMFSDDILIQTSDQHGLVDLRSGDMFNTQFRRVVLEDHVWLGRRCILMPDVTVHEGAVVGAGAVVTDDVRSTEIVAGVPARKVRQDITWSRTVHELDAYCQHLISARQSHER